MTPEQIRQRLDMSTHRIEELEKFNQALIDERQTLKGQLNDCTRMLDASTSGALWLDKSGLIIAVNRRAVTLLEADKAYLLNKPISLFIAPEYQALFYINRSRIVAENLSEPFEIKLKTKTGILRSARIHAQPVETPGQMLPAMLLTIEDIGDYRQALEALQLKEYRINLLFSITDDLATWSTDDIDEIISTALEKVGLVSGADRVYICQFIDRKTRMFVTHQWCDDGIKPPEAVSRGAAVETFSLILEQVKTRSTINVAAIEALAPETRYVHDQFHAKGVKSFLFTPLFYDRYLLGIIGCDAVRQSVIWSPETEALVRCVGTSIVSALLRRQAAELPAEIRLDLLRFVEAAPRPADDPIVEYVGPVEIVDGKTPAEKKRSWRFEKKPPADPQAVITALLKDGQTANLACRHCNRQKLLNISEIRALGTRLRATCICGQAMDIRIELRREHRKTVDLEGVYILGKGERLALKSDDWGRIRVSNLSRHGLAFRVIAKADLRVEDRFRVKFTLDNTALTVIQKEVVVRSVTGETIGCQFCVADPVPSDVTLGFYMLS